MNLDDPDPAVRRMYVIRLVRLVRLIRLIPNHLC
jgi:hypothetical protein